MQKRTLLLLLFSVLALSSAQDQWLIEYVTSTMNMSVDPCEDFYAFSCGGWIAKNVIPPDRGRLDRAFTGIDENNEKILRQILEDPTTDKKLLDFYHACLDTDTIEKRGIQPIIPFLNLAQSLKNNLGDVEALFRVVAILHSFEIPAFFGFTVDIDPGNPTINIATLGQGGLSLPVSEMYLDEDSAELRAQYLKHITNMFQLIGFDSVTAASAAFSVLNLETQLAKYTYPPDEMNDPFQTYNPMPLSKLISISALPWRTYFDTLGATITTNLTIDVPTYFTNLSTVITSTSDDWIAYLQWQIVRVHASLLTKAIVDENFEFFGKTLRGLRGQPTRERTCVKMVDSNLGELLGMYFVQRAFPGESKNVAQEMINNIEDAMEVNLKTIDWMDNITQSRALLKLKQVYNMIGYPDNPTNYTYVVDPYAYADNVIRANAFEFSHRLAKLGKPADRGEWAMTPPTVNAYYEPTKNEMVFPAGILQTPFFNLTFPSAMIYGAAGMVMGHELTHGFDNQGKDYSGTGQLIDWWQPETKKNFNEKVGCIIDQYSKFEVLPGLFVNGKLTQGENIADCGGIKLAYNSWLKVAGDEADKPSIIPQLTNKQLFFVAFAQGWCSKATPEETKIRLLTDPHSPPRFRVLGPLMNFPEFANAYKCAPNTPMNPSQRCTIW